MVICAQQAMDKMTAIVLIKINEIDNFLIVITSLREEENKKTSAAPRQTAWTHNNNGTTILANFHKFS